MTDHSPNRSTNLPEDIKEALESSSDRQLRSIIDRAQVLLRDRQPPTTEIEARDGEELLRIEDEGPYTIAIVRRTDESGVDRGPFAYRVVYEPAVDDREGSYHWHYLDRVNE